MVVFPVSFAVQRRTPRRWFGDHLRPGAVCWKPGVSSSRTQKQPTARSLPCSRGVAGSNVKVDGVIVDAGKRRLYP